MINMYKLYDRSILILLTHLIAFNTQTEHKAHNNSHVRVESQHNSTSAYRSSRFCIRNYHPIYSAVTPNPIIIIVIPIPENPKISGLFIYPIDYPLAYPPALPQAHTNTSTPLISSLYNRYKLLTATANSVSFVRAKGLVCRRWWIRAAHRSIHARGDFSKRWILSRGYTRAAARIETSRLGVEKRNNSFVWKRERGESWLLARV